MQTIIAETEYATQTVLALAEAARKYNKLGAYTTDDDLSLLSYLMATPVFANLFRNKPVCEWANVNVQEHAFNIGIMSAVKRLARSIVLRGTTHPAMFHDIQHYTQADVKELSNLPNIALKDAVLTYIGAKAGVDPGKVDANAIAASITNGKEVIDIYVRSVAVLKGVTHEQLVSAVNQIYSNNMLKFNTLL